LEFARKREKFLRQQSNILIVFMLTGLWHGASWNFVLWGIYFGVILAVEASGFVKVIKKLPVFIQHIYAMGLIILGWVFFRITDIGNWGSFLKALVGSNGWASDVTARSLAIIYYLPYPIIAIIFCLPIFFTLEKRIDKEMGPWRLVIDLLYIALFVLSVSAILAKGFNAFLYGQF
jgi:alginate O-acetyltransferase complex protein AlgI